MMQGVKKNIEGGKHKNKRWNRNKAGEGSWKEKNPIRKDHGMGRRGSLLEDQGGDRRAGRRREGRSGFDVRSVSGLLDGGGRVGMTLGKDFEGSEGGKKGRKRDKQGVELTTFNIMTMPNVNVA